MPQGNNLNEYVVVLRAPSGALFREGKNFKITNFKVPSGKVDIFYSTRYLDNRHIRGLVPISQWVEVRGNAASIKEAINVFSNAAKVFVPILSFCTNSPIGELQPELAYNNTNLNQRDFFQQHLIMERIRPFLGRLVHIPYLTSLLESLKNHNNSERLHRAISHYSDALTYWEYGKDILSVSRLYMGIESLTPVVRRIYQKENNLTKDKVINKWNIERKQLDSETKKKLIFQNDEKTYKDAKDVSDSFEHGYKAFTDIRKQAIEVKEKTAYYLRTAILNILDIDKTLKDKLTRKPFEKPFALEFNKYYRGLIIGNKNDLAIETEEYPMLRIVSIPKKIVNIQGEIIALSEEKITPLIGNNLKFQPTSFEVWGGPRKFANHFKPSVVGSQKK